MRRTLAAALLALAVGLAAAEGEVAASLHLDHRAAAPGDEVLLVLRLVPQPGWHVYWRNPGESGLPTRLEVTTPPGIVAGEPRWPVPQRFTAGGIVGFGYEELLLAVPLQVASDAPGGTATITAEARWLACQEACIPGRAELAATLAIGTTAEADPAGRELAARATASLPAEAAPWRAAGQATAQTIVIDLHPLSGDADHPAELAFYPATEGVVDLAAAQDWLPGPLPQLTLRRQAGSGLPPALEGLLVAGDGRAWAITLPLAAAAAP